MTFKAVIASAEALSLTNVGFGDAQARRLHAVAQRRRSRLSSRDCLQPGAAAGPEHPACMDADAASPLARPLSSLPRTDRQRNPADAGWCALGRPA